MMTLPYAGMKTSNQFVGVGVPGGKNDPARRGIFFSIRVRRMVIRSVIRIRPTLLKAQIVFRRDVQGRPLRGNVINLRDNVIFLSKYIGIPNPAPGANSPAISFADIAPFSKREG